MKDLETLTRELNRAEKAYRISLESFGSNHPGTVARAHTLYGLRAEFDEVTGHNDPAPRYTP